MYVQYSTLYVINPITVTMRRENPMDHKLGVITPGPAVWISLDPAGRAMSSTTNNINHKPDKTIALSHSCSHQGGSGSGFGGRLRGFLH
jgi:hypothetical protein